MLKVENPKFNGIENQPKFIEIWCLLHHRTLKHNFHQQCINKQCEKYFNDWKNDYPVAVEFAEGEIYQIDHSSENSQLTFKGIFKSEEDVMTIEKLLMEKPNCEKTSSNEHYEEIFNSIKEKMDNEYPPQSVILAEDNSNIYNY